MDSSLANRLPCSSRLQFILAKSRKFFFNLIAILLQVDCNLSARLLQNFCNLIETFLQIASFLVEFFPVDGSFFPPNVSAIAICNFRVTVPKETLDSLRGLEYSMGQTLSLPVVKVSIQECALNYTQDLELCLKNGETEDLAKILEKEFLLRDAKC